MAMDVGGAKGGIKSDINVTPLVDVMLVLLIIMMIVAPLLQKGADVKLPVAAYSEGGEFAGAYGAIVYGRGPLFFEALRDEMGQATFDAFLRDYVQENRWGIATTESLRALAEQHCGCDLEALFEEWVY